MYGEKTGLQHILKRLKLKNVYVTLKLEMFTVSVRNTGCKREKNKLKSISVFTEARSEGQGHKILCGSGKSHQCLQTYQAKHTCD